MARAKEKDTSDGPSAQQPEPTEPLGGFAKILDGFEAATEKIMIPPGQVALSIALISGYKTFRDFSIPLGKF